MPRALAILLLLVPAVAAAGPATKTLKSVKAYYGGVKQYSADFEQEVVNATFGSTKKNKGTLALKSKAKMFSADLDTSGSYGGKGDTVVELTPKVASAQYKRVYLVVASDGSVSETVVVDPSDNINHFRFANVDTATAIPDKRFEVSKKKLSKYRRIR